MASVISLVAIAQAFPWNETARLTASPQGSLPISLHGAVNKVPSWPMFVKRSLGMIPSLVTRNEQVLKDVTEFDSIVEDLKSLSDYANDRATVLAYDAAGTDPSPEARNYAHGFAQFFGFEYPESAAVLADKSESDRFLWFMGKAGSVEAKQLVNDAIRIGENKIYHTTNPIYSFSLPPISDAKMSLEAYIWLRNFEQFTAPQFPSEPKTARMNRIAGYARNNFHNFAESDAMKVFNHMYPRAHPSGSAVPDFAVLDYDGQAVLAEIKASETLA